MDCMLPSLSAMCAQMPTHTTAERVGKLQPGAVVMYTDTLECLRMQDVGMLSLAVYEFLKSITRGIIDPPVLQQNGSLERIRDVDHHWADTHMHSVVSRYYTLYPLYFRPLFSLSNISRTLQW